MDCTICTMGSSRIKGFSASCSKAVSVPEIRSPGPDGERTSTSGSMCADPRSGRALQRRRMPFAGLKLHHGLRGGCAAPESEAVVGATPRPGRFACHSKGWDVHAIPTLCGRSLRGQRSLAGRRNGKPRWVASRLRLAMPYSPPASRLANRPAAYSKRRPTPFRTDCWLGVTPKRRGGWGCTSPSCPMPIEACRDGGSLPATASTAGSASPLRRTWRNRNRNSDMRNRRRVHRGPDFLSGDPRSAVYTRGSASARASGAQNGSLGSRGVTPRREPVDHRFRRRGRKRGPEFGEPGKADCCNYNPYV